MDGHRLAPAMDMDTRTLSTAGLFAITGILAAMMLIGFTAHVLIMKEYLTAPAL